MFQDVYTHVKRLDRSCSGVKHRFLIKIFKPMLCIPISVRRTARDGERRFHKFSEIEIG